MIRTSILMPEDFPDFPAAIPVPPAPPAPPWSVYAAPWERDTVYEEDALVTFTLQPGDVGIWRSTRRTRGLSPGIGAWVEITEPPSWDDMTVYETGSQVRFGGRVWTWTGEEGTAGDPLMEAKWDFVRHSRQDWDPAEQIYQGDLVIYDGTAWTATADSMNMQPTDVVPTAPMLTVVQRAANRAREDLINRLYDALSITAEDQELGIRCFVSACRGCHGPDGQLSRLLFPERVVETWTGFTSHDRVIRPWERPNTGSVFIEWQDGAEASRGRLSVGQARQARDGRIYIDRDADFNPEPTDIVIVSYSASGLAADMTVIPPDLESAIFGKARQLFDFRDGFGEMKMMPVTWIRSTLAKYRKKPS